MSTITGPTDEAISAGMPPQDPLTPLLPIIDAVLRVLSRRFRLSDDEAEEFSQWAKLRLIENDHAIIQKYRGGNIQAYLIVVLTRLYFDFRASITGKFRPSAVARRGGDVAMEFERLIVRDKYTLQEAFQILRSRGRTFSEATLEALAVTLPIPRSQIVAMDPADLETVPHAPHDRMHDPAKVHCRDELLEHLDALLRALPPPYGMVIRMHCRPGVTISEIARTLNLDEQPLRRRLKRVLQDLREALERLGFDRTVLRDLFS